MKALSQHIWRYHDDTQATSYLIVGNDRAAMIDCGTGHFPVMPMIRAVTDLPAELWLTHAHPDHCGAADEFSAVWLHQKDAALLHQIETAFAQIGGRPIPRDRLRLFDDHAVIDLGGRQLRVLPVPGHTPGSVIFVDAQDKAIFSGDAVGSGDIVLMSIPFTLDLASYRRSLIALTDMLDGCKDYTWYPGHYHQAGVPGTAAYNPVQFQTVRDMIHLCGGILDGTITGEPVREALAPGGRALRARWGKAGMIYFDE
ncbi:MAG: MBL fold metallo-hydrolase [Clostridia bacterium]|nr:MBL fold metallo-hydrolase [Clostridia bacterium]